MAEKYTIMAHFSANNTCASGATRRSGGNPEHDNKYLGGEHGENDKGDNGGTDERAVSY
ncbi:hypothetical protein [Sinanaerobacter chloroacetimidivorans]|uniref:hypothetical protein n=1 Tax=Sinanaerobacter chloroacetimidivorans TaxID=2818044 RepID=UPI001D04FC1C|nr:hypothetical protein [Sinanaerobacter chloroacetimidivorans]